MSIVSDYKDIGDRYRQMADRWIPVTKLESATPSENPSPETTAVDLRTKIQKIREKYGAKVVQINDTQEMVMYPMGRRGGIHMSRGTIEAPPVECVSGSPSSVR